jgi:hypothetical protein
MERGASPGHSPAEEGAAAARAPPHPQTARDRWRLRKKLNCGAHMSASGEGTIRNMCTQIRSDTGAQRLEDVENGENQGEEELQWQISK